MEDAQAVSMDIKLIMAYVLPLTAAGQDNGKTQIKNVIKFHLYVEHSILQLETALAAAIQPTT